MSAACSSPRFGLIGAGSIGRIHLEALRAAGLPVVAIADPVAAAREKAREFFPDAVLHQDWRTLLADPAVDAVNICTISSLHYEILRAAVATGKHVLCEKTLTADGAEAREALTLKLKPGQIVQSAYMKRFFPASVQAKAWLDGGEIGQPLCATVRSFQGGWCDETMFDNPGWKPGANGVSSIRTFASGGMLHMAGSHLLDMTGWLLGEPATIACETWAPAGYDAELHAHALFKMRAGSIVHFEAALTNLNRLGAYQNGWDEFIEITGTKGRIELCFPLWNEPFKNAPRVRIYRESQKAWQEASAPLVNPFQLEMEAFARACRGEPAEFPTLRDGLLVDLWIDACLQSAASGGRVPFPVY